MNTTGYITQVQDGEGVFVFVPLSDTAFIDKQQITQVYTRFDDGRTLSALQRMKIHALIRDITDYVVAPGSDKKIRTRAELETLRQMQVLYLLDSLDYLGDEHDKELIRRQLTTHYCQITEIDLFSLSPKAENAVDMSTARDFIDWLVEMCVVHGIPCLDTLLNRCEDQGRYLYACVSNRRCAICGKKAEIHEVDRVGRGRNRNTIHHLGVRVQPLCRGHHQEVDNAGQKSFDKKYGLACIPLDENLCRILKWKP